MSFPSRSMPLSMLGSAHFAIFPNSPTPNVMFHTISPKCIFLFRFLLCHSFGDRYFSLLIDYEGLSLSAEHESIIKCESAKKQK